MSDQERLHAVANVMVAAATLPGVVPKDVDELESRLKFIAYAQAQTFLEDPWPLLDVLLGVVDMDEVRRLADEARKAAGCGACHRCLEHVPAWPGSPLTVPSTRMILCPTCGNKRCPKATDHRLECTDSNEPGQPGSVFR